MNPVLTREQKRAFVAALTPPFGTLHLMCDGDLISMYVYRHTPMAYRVAAYINGRFRGAWLNADTPCPEQKYLRRIARPLFKPAELADLRRVYGAKKVNNDPRYCREVVYFRHDWASGAAVIAHLARVCQSIRLATDAEVSAMIQAVAVGVAAVAAAPATEILDDTLLPSRLPNPIPNSPTAQEPA
ncbi:MAG TPA: hypothetical protein PK947_05830 [Ottowia sp.]|jgi:hypothetical protein|nr:hypothetical protein [Ottowia sp.]